MVEFTSEFLLKIRHKALRFKVWFKVLNDLERGILTLAPKCVDKVRSEHLALSIARIIVKIKMALVSPLQIFRSKIARPLALRISLIAQKWGLKEAASWVEDSRFITYLAVVKFNDNPGYR